MVNTSSSCLDFIYFSGIFVFVCLNGRTSSLLFAPPAIIPWYHSFKTWNTIVREEEDDSRHSLENLYSEAFNLESISFASSFRGIRWRGTRFESHNSPRAANELCQEYQMRSTSWNWRLIEIHKPRSVNHLVYALIAFEARQLDWVGSPRAQLCCVTSRASSFKSHFTINTHGRPTSTFKALIKYVLIAQREIDWLRDWSRFWLSDNQANFLRFPKIEAKDAE